MFENIFTNKQEKPPEVAIEKLHADFESKEKDLIKDGADLLENAEPEKFRNKATNLLMATLLFATASTAFAGEQNNDKDLPAMGEEQQVIQIKDKINEKNNIADFDWQKIATKIEISIGDTKEDVKEQYLESISPWWDLTTDTGIEERESEFYKGVTLFDVYDYTKVQYDAISHSQNASEFFKNLPAFSMKGSGEGLSEKQKAMMLQDIGYYLENTYNMDILNSGEFVAVSDDKMFEALSGQVGYGAVVTSGTCGNIHTFLVKTAESLGVEAWLQEGTVWGSEGKANHVWAGLVVGEGDKKQIAFLDYGTLIPTGTLNYGDALGVGERYHRSVSILNTFVGNSTELLFPVKSRANKVIEKAIDVDESMGRLDQNLENEEIKSEGRSLEVNIDPEIKEIKLGSDSIGLAFFKFDDVKNNPYQSIKDLSAWRGKAGVHNERLGVEVGATVLNMNIKDLGNETTSSEELVLTLAADYIDKKQLTKSEYGEFIASWGATFTGAVSRQLSVDSKGSDDKMSGGSTEAAFGGRMVYLDPNNVGKFYIGVSELSRVTLGEFQNQELTTKVGEKMFSIGAEVKVFEGSVLRTEVKKRNLNWGKSVETKAGLQGEKFGGSISYEKKSSDYERFIPTSEKIEASASYKPSPKWEIEIIGAKSSEKYKDAKSSDTSRAEVKLRMFLR